MRAEVGVEAERPRPSKNKGPRQERETRLGKTPIKEPFCTSCLDQGLDFNSGDEYRCIGYVS